MSISKMLFKNMGKPHSLPLVAACLSLALIPAAKSEVTFDFDYSDPSAGVLTPAAKAALTTAGQNVASYFINYSANVTISVKAYNDPISPIWADAGTNYNFSVGVLGFDNPGVVGRKILTDGAVDENGSGADGYININMGDWYNYAGEVDPSMADFTSLMMHELGHSIGFFGALSQAGPPPFAGSHVAYDSFLTNSTGQKIVNLNPGTGMLEVDLPLWQQVSTSNGLYFSGPYAMEVYGGPVPLASQDPWQEGQSLHHPDYLTFPDIIMGNGLYFGTGPRDYSNLEIAMLKDIGYTRIVPEPGTSLLALGGLGFCLRRRRMK